MSFGFIPPTPFLTMHCGKKRLFYCYTNNFGRSSEFLAAELESVSWHCLTYSFCQLCQDTALAYPYAKIALNKVESDS